MMRISCHHCRDPCIAAFDAIVDTISRLALSIQYCVYIRHRFPRPLIPSHSLNNCPSHQLVYVVIVTRHFSTHSTSMASHVRRSTEDIPNSRLLLSVINLHRMSDIRTFLADIDSRLFVFNSVRAQSRGAWIVANCTLQTVWD